MNAIQFEVENMRLLLKRIKKALLGLILKFSFCEGFAVLSLFLSMVLAFWYGSQCVFGSKICPASMNPVTYTAGSVIRIFYAICLPAVCLNQFTPCLHKISQGRKAAKRIFAIIDR